MVVAVIAVLAALLLPALGMARESSRRLACSSNMKQVGLAILTYEATAHFLPPAASFFPHRRHNFVPHILPQLGEQAIAKQYVFEVDWDDPRTLPSRKAI